MNNKDITQIVIMIFLALTVVLSTYIIVDKKVWSVVKDEVLKIEYDKVWWKENYDFMKKSTAKQLEQYRAQFWDDLEKMPEANDAPVKEENDKWGSVSLEKVEKMKVWTYVMWKADADISFIEYSDLECPFCKRLHSQGTITDVLWEYSDSVNYIFKHFPLDFHVQAAMEAEALECVWELGWSEKYYEFMEKVFSVSKTNWNSFTKESISELAGTIWIDKASVLSCVESWKYTEKVKAQMNEWASLWVTGTPWNIIINNKTWEYKLLPWAYPASEFKKIIDWFLNK